MEMMKKIVQLSFVWQSNSNVKKLKDVYPKSGFVMETLIAMMEVMKKDALIEFVTMMSIDANLVDVFRRLGSVMAKLTALMMEMMK